MGGIGKPKALGQVQSFFKKQVITPSGNFFRKGGVGQQIVDTTSVGLRKASNTLNAVNREAGKVINSDVANNIALMAGPQGLAALQGLRGANQAVGLSANIAGQGSQLANRKNYSGSSGDVVNNILERSKSIGQTAASGSNIQFA